MTVSYLTVRFVSLCHHPQSLPEKTDHFSCACDFNFVSWFFTSKQTMPFLVEPFLAAIGNADDFRICLSLVLFAFTRRFARAKGLIGFDKRRTQASITHFR